MKRIAIVTLFVFIWLTTSGCRQQEIFDINKDAICLNGHLYITVQTYGPHYIPIQIYDSRSNTPILINCKQDGDMILYDMDAITPEMRRRYARLESHKNR